MKADINPTSESPATPQWINLIFKITFSLFTYKKTVTQRGAESRLGACYSIHPTDEKTQA